MSRFIFSASFLALFILSALDAPGRSAPALVAEYDFAHTVDQEGIADQSGHGATARLNIDNESAYVETDQGPAVRIDGGEQRVVVPPKVFPGARGTLVMKFKMDHLEGGQTLFRMYGKGGDGLKVGFYGTKFHCSYYHLAEKKWVRVYAGDKWQPGRWYRVDVTWDMSKEMAVHADGELAHKVAVSLEPKYAPPEKTVLYLGNDNAGSKNAMHGEIAYAALYDGPKPPGESVAGQAAKPRTFGEDEVVRLSNDRLSLAFSKEFAVPVGGARADGAAPLLSDDYFPGELLLWRLTFRDQGGRGDTVQVDNRAEGARSVEVKQNDAGRQAILTWRNVEAPKGVGPLDVTVTVDLPDGSDFSYWRIATNREAGEWRLWETAFPILSLAPADDDLERLSFAYPLRFGRLVDDPFRARSGARNPWDLSLKYPSSNMHMQFLSLYGPKAGTYVAVYDGEGYEKTVKMSFRPERKRANFELGGLPSNAQQTADRYALPYPFVLGTFEGDWYDACQVYRAWALEQRWSSKGPTATRADVPDWLKKTSLVLKNHMWSSGCADGPERVVEEFGAPVALIWYRWLRVVPDFETALPDNMKARSSNYRIGRLTPPIEAAMPFVKRSRGEGIHLLAFLSAGLYDQGAEPLDEDAKSLRPASFVDENGETCVYNKTRLPLWRLNPGRKLWQDRLVEMAEQCVRDYGFSGIYLDTIGRTGVLKKFDAETGEPTGRGNDNLASQRQLATRVREAIRRIYPEAIVGDEAAVEYFNDVTDLRLLHENCIVNGCPLFMAVYHDYRLFYGRTLGDAMSPEMFRQQAGSLFSLGSMIGRLTTKNETTVPFHEGDEANLDYLRRIMALREPALEFFNLGRMLRPARLDPEPAVIRGDFMRFHHEVPEVMTSTWRAPDGRVAILFLNITDTEKKQTAHFDTAEYGFRKGGKVRFEKRTPTATTPGEARPAGPTALPVTLGPTEMVLFVLDSAS